MSRLPGEENDGELLTLPLFSVMRQRGIYNSTPHVAGAVKRLSIPAEPWSILHSPIIERFTFS